MGPWQAALGDSFAQLHPSLRGYFATIPKGSVGRGRGVFDVVGTPRRWLWPILAILERDGVIFPRWERNVVFTVENRPVYSGLAAERRFSFATGERVMTDHVVLTRRGLEDRLGRHGWIVARLETQVTDGMLTISSVGIRVFGVPIPSFLAPRVTVHEGVQEERRQVSLTLDMPGVGRLYEYSGSFEYRIERGSAG